jgi:hypothetical protein
MTLRVSSHGAIADPMTESFRSNLNTLNMHSWASADDIACKIIRTHRGQTYEIACIFKKVLHENLKPFQMKILTYIDELESLTEEFDAQKANLETFRSWCEGEFNSQHIPLFYKIKLAMLLKTPIIKNTALRNEIFNIKIPMVLKFVSDPIEDDVLKDIIETEIPLLRNRMIDIAKPLFRLYPSNFFATIKKLPDSFDSLNKLSAPILTFAFKHPQTLLALDIMQDPKRSKKSALEAIEKIPDNLIRMHLKQEIWQQP